MSKKQPVEIGKEKPVLKAGKTDYLPVILFLSVALLTFLAYLRAIHAPLIFDDIIYIKASRLKNITQHLSLSFRSIPNLSFSMNYYLSGMNLAAFRITNVIFHVLSAVLAFYLTYITLRLPSMRDKYSKLEDRKIPLYISLFTTTLFLLHPIQTSAVNYITQRMAIMACMFSFAGTILYVKGATATEKKPIYYAVSVFCFVLAVFSKENAVMVLPALLLYDFIFISSFRWSEFRQRFIPLAVLFIILGSAAVYYFNAGRIIQSIIMLVLNPNQPMGTYGWSGMDIHWTPVEFVLTELRIVSRYIFLVLVPIPSFMVFDYSNSYPVSKSLLHPLTTLSSFFFLLSIFAFSLRYFKKVPLISFGILWYLITIFLESFIALGLDPYFEHRNYLPSYGLFLSLASLLIYADKPGWKVKTASIILFTALLLFVLTFTRNGVWREGRLLWENAVEKSPNNARAHVNLGIVYTGKGWLDKAIEHFQFALKLKPESAEAHENMGVAYARKGLRDKAVEEYRTTLKLQPNYYEAHYNMGIVFFENGDIDKAIEEYTAALKIRPDLADVHVNMGIAYGSKGLMDQAIEHLQTAVELDPDFAEAHNNLGIAYAKLGSFDKAVEQYRIAVKLQPSYMNARANLENAYKSQGQSDKSTERYQPAVDQNLDNAEAHFKLGNDFFKNNRKDQAIEQYQLAVKLKPDFIAAHYNLGVTFSDKGLLDKAVKQYQLVIKLAPDYAEAHENLGVAYISKGLIDKAVEHFKIAIALNPNNPTFRSNLARAYQMKAAGAKSKTAKRK
jgi:protein O-mannosyl-transferase